MGDAGPDRRVAGEQEAKAPSSVGVSVVVLLGKVRQTRGQFLREGVLGDRVRKADFRVQGKRGELLSGLRRTFTERRDVSDRLGHHADQIGAREPILCAVQGGAQISERLGSDQIVARRGLDELLDKVALTTLPDRPKEA